MTSSVKIMFFIFPWVLRLAQDRGRVGVREEILWRGRAEEQPIEKVHGMEVGRDPAHNPGPTHIAAAMFTTWCETQDASHNFSGFDQTVESIPADWVDDQCFVCADGLDADRDIAPVYRIQAVGVLLKHEAGRG
jgi:hypothetical protein